MSHHKKQEHHIRPFKILAQTFGLLACCFFLLIMIGNDLPDMIRRENNFVITLLPVMLIPILGYIISWFKEWPGALLLIVGGICLVGYFSLKAEIGTALLTGIPFILSGSLFLLHIKKRNELHKQ